MYVFAALARTRGDINKASGENLEGHLLILFPYQSEPQRQCNNVGISLFHFKSMSPRLAAKFSQTINSHKKLDILEVERVNYVYELQ